MVGRKPGYGIPTGGGGGGGTVDTIVQGSGITIDATDPANPIVALVTPGLTYVKHQFSWDSPINTFYNNHHLWVPYHTSATITATIAQTVHVTNGGAIRLRAASWPAFSAGTQKIDHTLAALNITNGDGTQYLQLGNLPFDGDLPSGNTDFNYGHNSITGLWSVIDSGGGDLAITAQGLVESTAGGVFEVTATISIAVASLVP